MNSEIADQIRAKKATMALWITDAFFRSRPELEERWGKMGRTKCAHDTEYHFSYLAEAVRFEYPELFVDYVGWAKILFHSLNIPPGDLLQNLHWMKAGMHRMLPGEPSAAADPILDRVIRELPNLPSELPSYLKPDEPLFDLATEWLQHLLARRTREARNLILDNIKDGIPVIDLYQYVITPTMYEVGRLWQIHTITEAEEHFCSQTTQTMLALMTSYFEVPKTRLSAVGFCVANEQHDMGIRLVMDCYSLHGWNSVCLGSNIPPRNIESVLRNWKPDVLAISATMTYHLTDVVAAINAVREARVDKIPKVLVGGRPFKICPDLWRRVGADIMAHSCTEAMSACMGLWET